MRGAIPHQAQLELKGVRDERDRLDRQLQLERDARQSLEGVLYYGGCWCVCVSGGCWCVCVSGGCWCVCVSGGCV